ncbi:helix-turn-helix transcriptional regulator [Marinicrinis sediminis]|uniref:Helix-turn-helix transcriptional regulator n=1 Tax=Marinicrinis sediminis TaxID=1652465 RepID=A0ABW5R9E3_9BACL
MKIDRLLSIVMILLHKRRVQAKELAEMFEVSQRTIYRDIETINMAGIPIITFPGNQGGIGIAENYKLERNMLTIEEMASIITALRSLNTSYPDAHTQPVLQKIQALQSLKDGEKLQAISEQLLIDHSCWGSSAIINKKQSMMKLAIENNQTVIFRYRNAKNEEKDRHVEPHTLVLKNNRWYVYAHCRDKHDFRFFKLSRMKNLHITSQAFDRKETKLEQIPWNTQWSQLPAKLTVTLKFQASARFLVEEWFDEEEIDTDASGCMIVTTRFPDDPWVTGFVLRFGDQVEVIQPERLRQHIYQVACEVAKKYAPFSKPSQT